MKQAKHYRVRTLFNGSVIGKEGKYVAIPDVGYKDCKIIVHYREEEMIVENWLKADGYRRFPDKFGRGKMYTLGYFKWNPSTLDSIA